MKSKFNLSRLLIILGAVIVFGLLLFFLRNHKQALNVVLTTLTGFTLIFTVIYEGDLKRKKKNGSPRLTGMGILLVALYLFISVLNGINSNSAIIENEQKIIQDSIETAQIISNQKETIRNLEERKEKDSLNIVQLNAKIARLDTTLILNAIKQLDEQRRIVEKEKQNAFIHLKTEILYNLRFIYLNLNNSKLDSYKDTTIFIVTTGINIVNIENYQLISSNENIINNLTAISKSVKDLDQVCKVIMSTTGEGKISNIEVFKKSIAQLNTQLYVILCQILTYESFNEFESHRDRLDFKYITVFHLEKLLDIQFTKENRSYYFDRLAEVKDFVNEKKKRSN